MKETHEDKYLNKEDYWLFKDKLQHDTSYIYSLGNKRTKNCYLSNSKVKHWESIMKHEWDWGK